MDILEHALAQRIGGADGEIVEALCDEVVRLRAALSGLLDRNITYSGSDVILPFASHGIAIRQVADARELMTHNDALRGRASAACEGPLEGTVMPREDRHG